MALFGGICFSTKCLAMPFLQWLDLACFPALTSCPPKISPAFTHSLTAFTIHRVFSPPLCVKCRRVVTFPVVPYTWNSLHTQFLHVWEQLACISRMQGDGASQQMIVFSISCAQINCRYCKYQRLNYLCSCTNKLQLFHFLL